MTSLSTEENAGLTVRVSTRGSHCSTSARVSCPACVSRLACASRTEWSSTRVSRSGRLKPFTIGRWPENSWNSGVVGVVTELIERRSLFLRVEVSVGVGNPNTFPSLGLLHPGLTLPSWRFAKFISIAGWLNLNVASLPMRSDFCLILWTRYGTKAAATFRDNSPPSLPEADTLREREHFFSVSGSSSSLENNEWRWPTYKVSDMCRETGDFTSTSEMRRKHYR